jgi:hypothetical protein
MDLEGRALVNGSLECTSVEVAKESSDERPDENAARPIEGDVIQVGRQHILSGIYGGLSMLAVGSGMVWIWYQGYTFSRGLEEVRIAWWGALLFAAGAALGLYLVGKNLRVLRSKQRLVIGPDRLQVVRARQGSDRVVGQLLFRDISDIACKKDKDTSLVVLTLKETRDPESFGPLSLIGMRAGRGRFLILSSLYLESDAEIYEKIRCRYKPQ